MNEKELYQLFYLKQEKEIIKNIAEYKDSDELRKAYDEYFEKIEREEEKILAYINTIDDSLVRAIIELRFIQCKSWGDIGKKLNYERSSVYKILKRYLETHNRDET